MRSRTDGFALLIVLWSVAVLALLGTQLTMAARADYRDAVTARDAAVLNAAADGAIRAVGFALIDRGEVPRAGTPFHLRIGQAAVDVDVEDEAAKINPNTASRSVLERFFAAIGVDPSMATLLAGEVTDWRLRTPKSVLGGLKLDRYRDHGLSYGPSDRPFVSVEELRLVPDMTDAIAAEAMPFLSVAQQGPVARSGGFTPVSAALNEAGLDSAGAGRSETGVLTARLAAVAVLPGRARLSRSAVLRIRTRGGTGPVLEVLAWD